MLYARLLIISLLIASCNSFTPLYGKKTSASKYAIEQLPNISIETISGTDGFFLRSHLEEILQIKENKKAEYRLNIQLSKNISGVSFQRTGINTKYNVFLVASYYITDINTGNRLFAGSIKNTGSYDTINSPYSEIVVQNQVIQDSLRELAAMLKINIINNFMKKANEA
jgi:hypothetical protein